MSINNDNKCGSSGNSSISSKNIENNNTTNNTLSRLQQAFKNQEEAMRANPKFRLPPAPGDISNRKPSELSLTAPKFGQISGLLSREEGNDDFDFNFNPLSAELNTPISLSDIANSESTSSTLNNPSTSTSLSTHNDAGVTSNDALINTGDSSSTSNHTTIPQSHKSPNKVVSDILNDDLLDRKLATRKHYILPSSPLSPSTPTQIDETVDHDSKDDPIASQVWKLYAKHKSSIPNAQRMENLSWRMMMMSLRRKKHSESNHSLKDKIDSPPTQDSADFDNRSDHSSPTPEAQPATQVTTNTVQENLVDAINSTKIPLPDEDDQEDEEDERGRKPRRHRAPRKQTNVVVGFAGKVPEGLDNGEAIVDDLMDWRGKSRSRSRSVMDWRGQSRSRSRPPQNHQSTNPSKSYFIPSLPTHTPSPDTANNADACESTPDHQKLHQNLPSRIKNELTTTIEEDSIGNDHFYHFGTASSLPDPQFFLHHAQQNNTNRANDPQQNFYDLLSDNKDIEDLLKGKPAQQSQYTPSPSLLSKSLSSSYEYRPEIHNVPLPLTLVEVARKRPAEYSPKFTTLFNNIGNGQSDPPPFSLTSSFMPHHNKTDNHESGVNTEGSLSPDGIDLNEKSLVLPDGFPDDGGLSALLSQSAPGDSYGVFPPTIPQGLPTYQEYAPANKDNEDYQNQQSGDQDWNNLFSLLYGTNSAPSTPSLTDSMNSFAANINPASLFNKKNREVKPMRTSNSSQSSSKYASQSPQLPTQPTPKLKSSFNIQSKPHPIKSQEQNHKSNNVLSTSVPSIPITKTGTQSGGQSQQRSSYVPLRQAPVKQPSNPNSTASHSDVNLITDIQSANAMTCYNCKTTKTPLWRRDPDGNSLCNACGLFLKLHGVVRPLSLKSDVIKKRNRNGAGSNNPKTVGKKGAKEGTQRESQAPSSSDVNSHASTNSNQDNYAESSPALLPFMGLPPQPVVNTKKRRTSAVQQQQFEQLEEKQIESSVGYLSIDRSV
ncbi:hypothetical protein E3P84_03903 [Wallemia ichthyophaga]|nr:hypothetical protein E3P84_03903 [Wallemia ichthyophaga]TIB38628.1 hypothetical protein E3P83_03893 [Wallemia ichthyophaga]